MKPLDEEAADYLGTHPEARHAMLKHNHRLLYRINPDGSVTRGRELLAEVVKGAVPEGGVYQFDTDEEHRRLSEHLDVAFKRQEGRSN
jgi:hypothetical protein